jgi:hypothetical protein
VGATVTWFGRTFEVQGQVILPCDLCGTPQFPYATHECIGLEQKLLDHYLGEREKEPREPG